MGERRGRGTSRFNAFIDAVKDHVQPKSPRDTAASPDPDSSDMVRGRPFDKLKGKEKSRQSGATHKERFSLKLGDLLKSDGDENKDCGDGWKEFKKGFLFVLFLSINLD
jgi:arrestin-related trafficking adapter 3/6